MLSAQPGLSPAQVSQILASSARPFPNGSTCAGICGAGLLDAGAAVTQAAGTTGTTTTTSTSTTTSTVPSGGPGDFGKTSPSNGENRLKSRVTFSWQSSSGATGYEVCLDTALNRRCDGAWQPVGGTSAAAPGLAGGTTFEGLVRAVAGSGATEADSGTFWTFSTR
jgi:serine protease